MAQATDQPFVHLHLHSQYSLLDGANRLDRLIKRVQDLGMDAVAVTDHGNLHGAAEFYQRATAAGIKPILGIEAYVAPDLDGKPSDRTSREYTGVSDGGFHLVLLAEDQTGWANLLKLSSDAFINGFYFKPRMDKTTLAQHREGLIAINGHLGSSIAHHLCKYKQSNDPTHWRRAVEEAKWHAELFGTNADGDPRFFLELQYHDEQLQRDINPLTIQLAEELGLPLVADNDAHFLTADDWDSHDTLCCISMGKTKAEESRLRYPRDLYVKSPAQMWDHFGPDQPEALRNTRRIADRCNVALDFEANHAPVVRIVRRVPAAGTAAGAAASAAVHQAPEGSTDWFNAFCAGYQLEPVDTEKEQVDHDALCTQCDEALRELCEAGLIWRYGADGVTDEIRARLERELKVLADKSISAYFLIVWDFVNYARSRGIPALARGSGVGTMVGFVLGLSNACPVEFGLLFERFTDPDRSEYPDIDIDLCQDGRAEVIDYVRQKYGHVAQIITFGTLKARAAIRDVGRVLDVPLKDVDELCKLVGDGLKTTIESAIAKEPDLAKLYDSSEQHRTLLDTARRLEGMARHAGVHAAGVIVATQPLDNIVPLYQPAGTDQIVTQWDGPTCESVGLLKMDFLGLRTLSIIEKAKALVRETLSAQTIAAAVQRTKDEGTRQKAEQDNSDPSSVNLHPSTLQTDPLDLERIRLDDPRVYELFQRGDTAGVFQFESGGMQNLLKAMKPDRLEDLIAANALYRPGPMALIPNYNNRKHGREVVPKVHPIVDRLCSETQGIMVYQEQVMQIVHELGDIPLRSAYTLIKAISKKKEKTINANRAKFIDGAAEKGLSNKQAEELFDLILEFAGYGFNKSHSTGYAIVAYQTAYLKTFFPLHYMAAVLTYESVNTDKVVEYLDACKHVHLPDGSAGIEVRPADINRSGVGFTVVYEADQPMDQRNPSQGHIRFGLSAVKGVGEKAIQSVIAERTEHGPFKSLLDFCERVDLRAVNRSTIEALIKCGAFDDLHGGTDFRAAMCEALEGAVKAGQRAAADRHSGQMSIFGAPAPGASGGDAAAPEAGAFQLPTVTPWDQKQTLEFEKEVMGLYVSAHPLDDHREALDRYRSATIAQAQQLRGETAVDLSGIVAKTRTIITRKGDKMAVIELEDRSGKIEAVAFPKTYDVVGSLLSPDSIIVLQGKVDRKRETPQIIIDKVVPIEQAAARLTRAIKIVVDDPTPADRGTSINGELADLREVLRQASQRGEHRQAQVMLELRQGTRRVRMRMGPMRVHADEPLRESVQRILGRGRCTAQCELLGPAPLLRGDRAQSLLHSDGDDAGPTLAMRSSVQGEDASCASIDRY